MSPSSRSAIDPIGSAAPTSCSNFPGSTSTHSAPACSAPACAGAPNWCHANSSFAPESERWKPTSRSLSSGFIGTTTAPSRSAP